MRATKRKPAKKAATLSLNDVIIQSIQDKKGENIICIDLRNISDTITDYFIICDADNTTQVKAIADHVMEETMKKAGEKPWHKEGFNELEWVLLDYVNVVVHVFHKPARKYYQLEELWNDGAVLHIND